MPIIQIIPYLPYVLASLCATVAIHPLAWVPEIRR